MNRYTFFATLFLVVLATKTCAMEPEENSLEILEENSNIIFPLIVRCAAEFNDIDSAMEQAKNVITDQQSFNDYLLDNNKAVVAAWTSDKRKKVARRIALGLIGTDGETVLHHIGSSETRNYVAQIGNRNFLRGAHESDSGMRAFTICRVSDGFSPMHCVAINVSMDPSDKAFLMNTFIACKAGLEGIKDKNNQCPCDLLSEKFIKFCANSSECQMCGKDLLLHIEFVQCRRQALMGQLSQNQNQEREQEQQKEKDDANEIDPSLASGPGDVASDVNNTDNDENGHQDGQAAVDQFNKNLHDQSGQQKQDGTGFLNYLSQVQHKKPIIIVTVALAVVACGVAVYYRYFNRKQDGFCANTES